MATENKTETKPARERGTQVSTTLSPAEHEAFRRVFKTQLTEIYDRTGKSPRESDLVHAAVTEYVAKHDA